MRIKKKIGLLLFLIIFISINFRCMSAYKKSVNAETTQIFQRIYVSDLNIAWESVLDSLKNISIDISNKEGGYIQTRWNDNISEKNFTKPEGADNFLKAQYRFLINVSKGFYNGTPTIKISVQKEQLVQKDVLEGWKPVVTDSIEENTLLYRIGRIISIKTKQAYLAEKKAQHEIQSLDL